MNQNENNWKPKSFNRSGQKLRFHWMYLNKWIFRCLLFVQLHSVESLWRADLLLQLGHSLKWSLWLKNSKFTSFGSSFLFFNLSTISSPQLWMARFVTRSRYSIFSFSMAKIRSRISLRTCFRSSISVSSLKFVFIFSQKWKINLLFF